MFYFYSFCIYSHIIPALTLFIYLLLVSKSPIYIPCLISTSFVIKSKPLFDFPAEGFRKNLGIDIKYVFSAAQGFILSVCDICHLYPLVI